MPTEVLAPDSIISLTELSGAVGDIDDDPSSPDANWLTASGNNVNTECHVSFPTPVNTPIGGGGFHKFNVAVRQFDEGQNGTPEVRLELWENGSLVTAGTDQNVSTGTSVETLSFDSDSLTSSDGSNIELKVIGTKAGGSPSNRNTVEVGAVELVAETISSNRLAPDAIDYDDGQWLGSITDIDEDILSLDANSYSIDAPATTPEFRVSFPSPSSNLETGAGLQTFVIILNGSYTSGELTAYLYESGSSVLNLGTLNPTYFGSSSTLGIFNYSWNASELSSINGSNVELQLSYSGSGSSIETLDINAIAWEYELAAITGPVLGMSLKGG